MYQYNVCDLIIRNRTELNTIAKKLYITPLARWRKDGLIQRILATQANHRGYDIISGK